MDLANLISCAIEAARQIYGKRADAHYMGHFDLVGKIEQMVR